MPRRVLNILVENFEIDEDVVLRTSERMDWDDWHQLTQAAPAAPEGRPVLAAQHLVGLHRDLRRPPRGGRAGPSPLRLVLVGRGVPAGGCRGSAGHRDQDALVPDRRELAAGRHAGDGRRAGQAGGGARRVEGALRRAQQHRLGDADGSGGHPRGVRRGEPEDARQVVPDHPQGAGRNPPLRARRAPATTIAPPRRSTPTSGSSPRTRPSSTTSPRCSTT